jgi:ferritin-like metal-binding protein YciE
MSRSEQKVVQYLNEAHASEVALVRVLQSQIAMTPESRFRSGLEKHLEETRNHAKRVQERIGELKEGSNPLLAVVGLAESIVGQAMALAKTPADLVRGTGGEEKVLKNAKDAAATEALEIATYTALEQLATTVGDDRTAKLAASIKADEERMLARILREIPSLTKAVVSADVDGDPSYDVTETGAAQAVEAAGTAAKDAGAKAGRKAATRGRKAAKSAADTGTKAAKATADTGTKAAKSAADTGTKAAKATADTGSKAASSAADATTKAAKSAEETGTKAAGSAKAGARQARKVPGVARAEGRAKGAVATKDDLPIARYDALNVEEVVAKLPKLSQVDLAKVDSYERRHENRSTVTDRVKTLQASEPWPGYDELTLSEVKQALDGANAERIDGVLAYERAHKARAGVLKAAEKAGAPA